MTQNGWAVAAAAVVAGLSAGAARADFGGAPPPPAPPVNYEYEAAVGEQKGIYGPHPLLRPLLFWKSKPKAVPLPPAPPPPNSGLPGSPGVGMPGTLVFPHHPYFRSPRDYFMYEPGGRR